MTVLCLFFHTLHSIKTENGCKATTTNCFGNEYFLFFVWIQTKYKSFLNGCGHAVHLLYVCFEKKMYFLPSPYPNTQTLKYLIIMSKSLKRRPVLLRK